MKTAGRGNPKRWATTSQQPSTWRGRSEQILFIHMGCEVRKIPAAGEIFFLTSAFIEHSGIRQVLFSIEERTHATHLRSLVEGYFGGARFSRQYQGTA